MAPRGAPWEALDWRGSFGRTSHMILAFFALLLGGILKGATGAGSPVIAVPLLAIQYDVPTAVALFSIPNLLSNAWQGWNYRGHVPSPGFAGIFAGTGIAGAAVGTVMLANLAPRFLLVAVASVVFAYVAFRLMRPSWQLSRPAADRLVVPAGFLGGILQGAAGVSAPVSVTFLNAMRLERAVFIGTISIFFFAMSAIQLPMLVAYDLLTLELFGLSLVAFIPLLVGMPIGAWLAKRISRETFDWVILAVLVVVAARLMFEGLA